MSMIPPPMDDWVPEEPPDLYFADTVLEEPPDWVYDEPSLDGDILARLDQYAQRKSHWTANGSPEWGAPPPIPSAEDYPMPDTVYDDLPEPSIAADIPVQGTPPPASDVERETDWVLQQSGMVIEAIQPNLSADPTGYAVGVAEVWQDPQTGDQAGMYLHMADAPHLARAEEMQANIYRLADESNVSDAEFGDFAHGLIKGRGEWQPFTESQWDMVVGDPAPDEPDFTDDTLWAERDRLLAETFENLDEPLERPDIDAEQMMAGLGIQIEDFDPATTPPPLFDEETNTAYWVGVYTDPETPDQGIASLLSVTVGEDGEAQARLAPVATGDLDHAQRTAEYLLKVADRTQDVGQMLDAAEGMAVATQNRELWAGAQGIQVEEDIAFSPVTMDID